MLIRFVIIIGCCFSGAAALVVSCEKILTASSDDLDEPRSCFMQEKTSISSADYRIDTKDTRIAGLSFRSNKKIKFLPVQISRAFPNLLVLSARICSISEVSKENFEGLKYLRFLYLDGNQIVKILADTFEDLESLEKVGLGK